MPSPAPPPPGYRASLALAFAVGLVSLVYEVIATKTLFFFFVESTWSVGIVLAAFLAGLAAGTALFRWLSGRAGAWTIVFWSQLLAGLYALAAFANFGWLPAALDAIEGAAPGRAASAAARVALCSLHVGVPALLCGVVFPLTLARGVEAKGAPVPGISAVYLLDLAGSALGALLTGIVALPLLGIAPTVYLAALVNFAVALSAAVALRRPAAVAAAGAAACLAGTLLALPWGGERAGDAAGARATPAWFDPDARVFHEVIDRETTPYGVVTVGRHPAHGKVLYVNYRVECTENDHESELEMGVLVGYAFESGGPKRSGNRVLAVGLGCGYTLMGLVDSPAIAAVDVVELNPAVIRMARTHFAASTEGAAASPKVRIVEDEGFHFLRTGGSRYDAVVVDIENPAVIHAGPLYTREFFAAAAAALEPGGLLALWAYNGSDEYRKVLFNTLRASFAHVVVRSNIDQNLVYLASQSPVAGAAQTPGEKETQARIEAFPSAAVNTLGNRVLERLFDPGDYFNLPAWYRDPYVLGE